MPIKGPINQPPVPATAPETTATPQPADTPVEAPVTPPEPAGEQMGDLPMNEEEFLALPPKQAFKAYMDIKTNTDKIVNDALDKAKAQHSTDIEEIKNAINEALYGDSQ